MAKMLKLRKVGNSVGVVLPKEMLALLNAKEGDDISVTETPNGIQLNKPDTEFEDHMKKVEKIMERYPNTLRALSQ
ncbi:MAG: transcriptional regulator [Hyphococcus sp.]|nr:MAG: transcriptional regulator [Marinicaulis sp.]